MSSTKKWYKSLYLQVLVAIAIGIVLGGFFPATGPAMKPLGDMFIAQATNVHLSLMQELAVLGVLLLTSKGGAGIAGSAFVVLAATLSSIGTIPVGGLTLILGIDRFMNEARALTNLVGNGVATLVVAKWENALDPARARAVLNGDTVPPLSQAEGVVAAELVAAEQVR